MHQLARKPPPKISAPAKAVSDCAAREAIAGRLVRLASCSREFRAWIRFEIRLGVLPVVPDLQDVAFRRCSFGELARLVDLPGAFLSRLRWMAEPVFRKCRTCARLMPPQMMGSTGICFECHQSAQAPPSRVGSSDRPWGVVLPRNAARPWTAALRPFVRMVAKDPPSHWGRLSCRVRVPSAGWISWVGRDGRYASETTYKDGEAVATYAVETGGILAETRVEEIEPEIAAIAEAAIDRLQAATALAKPKELALLPE